MSHSVSSTSLFSRIASPLVLFGAVFALGATSPAYASGDGEKIFKKRCASCHSMDAGKHRTGPSLAGVVGRKAGSTDFNKYRGLKDADFDWTEENLDKWLTNPKKFLGKGTSMTFKLKKAEERAAVIEYLKSED